MKNNYLIKTFIFFIFAIISVGISFFVKNYLYYPYISKSGIEIGKIEKLTTQAMFSKPVSIEIKIDDGTPGSEIGMIAEVSFDSKNLFLKPSDPTGDRGSVFLQVYPGTYTLIWKVQNEKESWPRLSKYEQKIRVEKTDIWKKIYIKGSRVRIS